MNVRVAILLLLLLAPLAGQAQPWLPQIQGQDDSSAVGGLPPALIDDLLALNAAPPQGLAAGANAVVPVWASADGHWLALVAFSQSTDGPLLPLAPALSGLADWRLMHTTGMAGGGLRWQLGSGFYADALLGQSTIMADGCTAPGCEFGRFELGQVRDGNRAGAAPGIRSGDLGMGWLSPGGDLDLSYGLSWLQADVDHGGSFDALPQLAIPGAYPYLLNSSTSLVANGRWKWDMDAPTINFGASFGRARVLATGQTGNFLLQPIDLKQASLTLGVGGDTFRGILVGRLLRSDDPSLAIRQWSALDLGVSWRTPWQGELSLGAQNVWSSSDPVVPADKVDPAKARMPYIQYRQDL